MQRSMGRVDKKRLEKWARVTSIRSFVSGKYFGLCRKKNGNPLKSFKKEP